jgi:hypothetical protein
MSPTSSAAAKAPATARTSRNSNSEDDSSSGGEEGKDATRFAAASPATSCLYLLPQVAVVEGVCHAY